MGFGVDKRPLGDYLKWSTSGELALPDFQRGYKWDDERIRSLLVTVLRGHPMGTVLLLRTGNDNVRFKPRPIEGSGANAADPEWLLLDGQQRLTSLTQALTGQGVVATTDSRGKLMDRRYYIDMEVVLSGEDRMDEAVISVPGDGIERTNFGRDIVRDLSSPENERRLRLFPVRLLIDGASSWLFKVDDHELAGRFNEFVGNVGKYSIPFIELDKTTGKAAVATVFEKVNTGGLALSVFELLTATFAGDPDYFAEHGTDFRLADDWTTTRELFAHYPVLAGLENTDFLQAVTLLATQQRRRADKSPRPPAISAKREDVLKLSLGEYQRWVEPLRAAFVWVARFLADLHVFDVKFLPYPKQLVPLAVLRVEIGSAANLLGPSSKLKRWFWCGILGELYGGAIETRFARDLEQVPAWARGETDAEPNTVVESTFVQSRLHSLRTRNAAAYKGIYALVLGHGARDWMRDQQLELLQYTDLAVDIHHIFPKAWCEANGIDAELRESIVNKTAISAVTNRAIGGSAPSKYLGYIECTAGVDSGRLDDLVSTHLVSADALRGDDFDAFYMDRREQLCQLVERATGKKVQRDYEDGVALESSAYFTAEAVVETVEEGE